MQRNRLIECIRRSTADDGVGRTDGELLGAFVRDKDGAALAALVRRHAPMVWGACRRILHGHQDAEDAFQATFLVLVQKAATLPDGETVGNWLYGVARQTAVRMRAIAIKRGAREGQVAIVPEPTSADEYLWNDLKPVLDEELGRLPEKYRVLLVLCDLEGRTRKEVAGQLALPEGTVASRLAAARALLARHLARRGVGVSGTLLGTVLTSHATATPAPAGVISITLQTAAMIAAGHGAAGALSPAVAALVTGVTRAMLVSKLGTAFAVVLVAGLALGGVGLSVDLFGGSAAMAQPKTPPTDPPAGAGEPVAARHRFTVSLTKAEPWPRVPRCAFLDNDRILVQDGSGTLEVRDAKTGKVSKSVSLPGYTFGDFRLSADRKSVAAVTVAITDGTAGTLVISPPAVTVWDTATWKVRGTINGYRLLDLAEDGRTVLVREDGGRGGQTGRIEVWDVVEKKVLKAAPFEFKRIDAAAISPDGSLVAVSGMNEIAYWKWRDGDKHERLKVGRKVDALVFSPDGKFVAEGPDTRETVEVRDTSTLKVTKGLSDPAQPRVPFMVAGVAFADSGKTLAFGNGVGLIETIPVPHRVHFWDVASGKITRKIDLKGGAPYALDVSPDGKTLAVVTADNGVALRVFALDAAPDPDDKDREYRNGQEEARTDVAGGALKYKLYGEPSATDELLGEILKADYKITLDVVAGCKVPAAVRQRADGYNEVLLDHMTKKGQKDFFAAAEKKAREEWDRLTPEERVRRFGFIPHLERTVSLAADKMPLRDALKKIAADAGLEAEFDTDALKKEGLDLEKPVSVKFESVPLARAIGLLIDWNAHTGVLREVRRGKLVFTTLEAWQARTAAKLPEWLKPLYNKGLLATLDDNDDVTTVTASGDVVSDELLAKLKTLPKLRELEIEVAKGITPAGLAHLAKMPRLERLSLYQINTGGAGLGDDAVRSLVGLESLRELSIAECGTTDAGAKLLEKLPQLTSLSLRQEGRLTDEALKSIAKLPRLKALALDSYVGTERLGWMRFSAAGVRQLKGLKELESLRLVGQEVPADALVFPKLTSLSLGHAAVDDDAATKIGELRELRSLELVYCDIGDAGLKSIANLPELRRLNVSSSRITDAGIGHFRTHKKVEHVTLRAAGLTDKALDHLAQIESLTRLDLYGSGEPGVAPGRNFSIAGLQQLKTLPKLDALYLTNIDSPGGYVGLKELKRLRELSFMMSNVTDGDLEVLEKALPSTRISSATGGGTWIGPKRKR